MTCDTVNDFVHCSSLVLRYRVRRRVVRFSLLQRPTLAFLLPTSNPCHTRCSTELSPPARHSLGVCAPSKAMLHVSSTAAMWNWGWCVQMKRTSKSLRRCRGDIAAGLDNWTDEQKWWSIHSGQHGTTTLSMREYREMDTLKFYKKGEKLDWMNTQNWRAVCGIQEKVMEKYQRPSRMLPEG